MDWGEVSVTLNIQSSTGTVIFYIHLFSFFWPRCAACGILVAPPGIEPTPPEMEAWSLTHWTAREVPNIMYRKVQHQVQI